MPECAALSGGDDADVTLLLSPSCQPCSCPERGFYKCPEARCGEVRTGWFPAALRGEGRGGRSAIARSEPGAELGHAQPGKNVVFSSCKDNSVLEKTLGSCCLCPSFRWAHLGPRCRIGTGSSVLLRGCRECPRLRALSFTSLSQATARLLSPLLPGRPSQRGAGVHRGRPQSDRGAEKLPQRTRFL